MPVSIKQKQVFVVKDKEFDSFKDALEYGQEFSRGEVIDCLHSLDHKLGHLGASGIVNTNVKILENFFNVLQEFFYFRKNLKEENDYSGQ